METIVAENMKRINRIAETQYLMQSRMDEIERKVERIIALLNQSGDNAEEKQEEVE